MDEAREALRYCNSYTRMPTLIGIWNEGFATVDEWLTLLGEEWSLCDNIGQFMPELAHHTPLTDRLALHRMLI